MDTSILLQLMLWELSIAYLSGSGIKLGGLGTISSSALIKLLQGDSSVLSFVSARVFSQSNEKTLFNYGDQVLYRAEKTSKPQKENIDLNISLDMKKINRNSNLQNETIFFRDLFVAPAHKDIEHKLFVR